MPVFFRSNSERLFLPLSILFAVLIACALYSHTTEEVEAPEEPDTIYTAESVVGQHKTYENWLQAKAEKVLEAFGESSPVVVVTVQLRMDMAEEEYFTPDPKMTVKESEQKTQEVMCKKNEEYDLLNPNPEPVPTAGKANYKNSKEAINYMVAQTKIKTVRKTPKLTRISCTAVLSEDNESRRQEIEKALYVALGLQEMRGDSVLATVR